MKTDVISTYLRDVAGYTEKNLAMALEKLSRHEDIAEELAVAIEAGDFPEDAIVVEGHTARKLSDTTYLSLIGVYNYLIYLRDKPTEALAALSKGLPRK
jgi:hypothetical protein